MDIKQQQQFEVAKFEIDGIFCKLHVAISQAREFLSKAKTPEELEEAKAMLDMAITTYYCEVKRIGYPTNEQQVKPPRIF